MENPENKEKIGECPPDSMDTQGDRNLLEEIKMLNQEMLDPKHQTFKKSTYWHQQSSHTEHLNSEALLKDMAEQLVKIEVRLTKIETLLERF